ncbi:hypothetical protein Skr01_00790 [Sphaerisporangium krabiense]|uniref:Peptidase MA-like domain-containing protein n=1 Tax=Sphaerisporangium krabiense TaxID=763782 RepID=A0A7W8Z854_9ACTN|nr:hypothetical protein [Sphaerisporangium krabiense]MBB5629164.1 hypothetical protein [Sphaerisporangium krabiense]GII59994.1 hypothetical protein Skr01_00790 [Sphaerisporangium krabiense]
MRVVRLGASLAGLLAALSAPAAAPALWDALPAAPGASAALSGAPAVPRAATADPGRLARAAVAERPDVWAGARIVIGERSVVVGAARTGAAEAADLARRADRAARVVARLAGPVRPLVLLPGTTAQAAALAAPASVRGLAAVAAVDHVIVEPGAYARLSDAGRDVVLAHELTHLATGAATDARTPKWLMEGFADYVGYLDSGIPAPAAAAELAAEVRAGRRPIALPGPQAFAPESPRLAQAYEEAWLACRYVVARYGERALVALYREFSGGGAPGALPRVLGVSAERFTAAWRAYVVAELS